MQALDVLHQFVGREDAPILWWQMCLRAALIFLFGLALLRVAGKRTFGKWGALDIILSVIVGSNLSRALTGSAPFAETLLATIVLILLHWALVVAAVRAPWLGPLIKGAPSRIVHDGQVDQRAMARHGIGGQDLEQALRCAGVSEVAVVQAAWLERNGEISVIRREHT